MQPHVAILNTSLVAFGRHFPLKIMNTLRRLGKRWQKASLSTKAQGKGPEEKSNEFDVPEASLERQGRSSGQGTAKSSET